MDADHPWIELAEELGVEVHRSWPGNRVPILQQRVGNLFITAHALQGDSFTSSTTVRAVYPGRGGFDFDLRSSRVSTELGKVLFGTQDLIVGDKSFDRRFVVRGSDEARTRAFFGHPRILELLKGYWDLSLVARPMKQPLMQQVRGDVEGLAEVVFRNRGVLSKDRLRRVFQLFHEILEELGVTATGDDHGVEALISRLRFRGGKFYGLWAGRGALYSLPNSLPIWDGDIQRMEAAKLLGHLGDPRAVEALVEVVSDPDDGMRLAAAEALGLIGDPRAVEALGKALSDPDDATRRAAAEALGLIGGPQAAAALVEVLPDPDAAMRRAAAEALGLIGGPHAVAPLSALLGDRSRVGDAVIAQEVARMLERLGAGDLVEAFHLALGGQDGALRRCVHTYRARTPVAHAMIDVMEGSELSAVEAAGRALAWLGVREVLPDLVGIERMTGWDRSRAACREAIAALESMDSLPRPADPVQGGGDTLPRPASTHEGDPTTLPRAATEEDDDS